MVVESEADQFVAVGDKYIPTSLLCCVFFLFYLVSYSETSFREFLSSLPPH